MTSWSEGRLRKKERWPPKPKIELILLKLMHQPNPNRAYSMQTYKQKRFVFLTTTFWYILNINWMSLWPFQGQHLSANTFSKLISFTIVSHVSLHFTNPEILCEYILKNGKIISNFHLLQHCQIHQIITIKLDTL